VRQHGKGTQRARLHLGVDTEGRLHIHRTSLQACFNDNRLLEEAIRLCIIQMSFATLPISLSTSKTSKIIHLAQELRATYRSRGKDLKGIRSAITSDRSK
tara:strand:+ start:663 stop:962 length:300 start_codon:yes stop_codon:yes gene_type:complete